MSMLEMQNWSLRHDKLFFSSGFVGFTTCSSMTGGPMLIILSSDVMVHAHLPHFPPSRAGTSCIHTGSDKGPRLWRQPTGLTGSRVGTGRRAGARGGGGRPELGWCLDPVQECLTSAWRVPSLASYTPSSTPTSTHSYQEWQRVVNSSVFYSECRVWACILWTVLYLYR